MIARRDHFHPLISAMVAIAVINLFFGCSAVSRFTNRDEALLRAVDRGDLHRVKQLVAEGADVNAVRESHRVPLVGAAVKGHVEVAKFLLEHGADVNGGPESYGGPLMLACTMGNVEVVKLLLRHGADASVTGKTPSGLISLLLAIVTGQTDAFKVLLEHVIKLDSKHASPDDFLLPAAIFGRTDIARTLLDHGANVNGTGVWITPLMGASCMPDQDSPKGVAFLKALERWDVVKGNLRSGSGTPLSAPRPANPETVKLLLLRGADVNSRGDEGGTALMWAAQGGNLEVVKLLLEKGADINAANKDGDTALKLARKNNRNDVERFLKAQGAEE